MSKLFDDMQAHTSTTAEEILKSMITKDESIKLKTVIPAPKEACAMRSMATVLNDCGFGDSGKLVNDWMDLFEQYMVSHKGMSWDKITKAVSAIFAAGMLNQEQSAKDRLLRQK